MILCVFQIVQFAKHQTIVIIYLKTFKDLGEFSTMFNRNNYLEKLEKRKNDGLIKVITGVRRVGKSYLLNELFYKQLLNSGVKADHIIRFAFDSLKDVQSIGDSLIDENSKPKKVNARKFIDFMYNRVTGKGTYYLLLDEIQNLEMFEAVLNGFLRDFDADIYVTGSNSRFLSKDVLTEFEGRGEEIHVFPLTLREYAEGTGKDIRDVWKDYIVTGGIPLIARMTDEEQRENYLTNLCNEVYLTDVIVRNKIRKPKTISELFDVVASTMASVTNPLKITNTFNAQSKEKVSCETIGKYLSMFEDAFLTKKVRRLDIEGRKYINASFKFYFEDIGIRNARLGFRQINDTHIMENIIFNELRFRGYNVDIGTVTVNEKTDKLDKNGKLIYKQKQFEVDFVATKGIERYYIQSAYAIPDEAKEKQEKHSLLKIDDSFRKLIIVHDDIKLRRDDKGITTMNIYDFLMDENSINA